MTLKGKRQGITNDELLDFLENGSGLPLEQGHDLFVNLGHDDLNIFRTFLRRFGEEVTQSLGPAFLRELQEMKDMDPRKHNGPEF